MKLRSRKLVSKDPVEDDNNDSSQDEGDAKDISKEVNGSESDEEIYKPASDSADSDSSRSGDQDEMDEEEDGTTAMKLKTKPVRIRVQEQSPQATSPITQPTPPITQPMPELFQRPRRSTKRKIHSRKKRKTEGPLLLWEVWEEEMNRWLDENSTADVDFDHQQGVINEAVQTPSLLQMPLLRYQKEWLAWALKQEDSETRGGILADEMGMGKTIQAIALVLAKRERAQAIGDSAQPSSSSASGLPEIRATLVVCPLVAVSQWRNEIERFTTEGSTKYLVYHGPNREKLSAQFSKCDFVITTYSTVEVEFRKSVMQPKTKCKYCGKAFREGKLVFHLKYYCGPNALRTTKQSKQNKRKADTSTEPMKGKKSAKHNTTDGHRFLKKETILHSVNWERVILDEAHFIKDRNSNTAKAIFALDSSYKWALSGTPLQNRVGELYSLIRFLQINPYSYYLCKDCDCRTLDFESNDKSSSRKCPSCPHSSTRHFCWWNRYVARPIQNFGNNGEGERAMRLLKQKVLKNIVLRRTKQGRAADLALPPRIVSLRRDALDIKEEDYYESLYTESIAQFNTYVEAGTLTNNYAHIFDLLTRLRQAVDHPYLVVYSRTSLLRNGGTVVDPPDVEQLCGICHCPAEDPTVAACDHVFCKSCLLDFSASFEQVSCPTCSKPLTVDFTTSGRAGTQSRKATIKGFKSSSILNRIQLENFQTSTKIEALREEIRFMVERDGAAKAIVFSQFTSFLDLINYSLTKSNINCVQLDGSMTLSAREAAINSFTEEPTCRIFLVSLKAGGVALNLTVASHVFVMDPWWNPAVERQAQDRIHRIGQYKPIRIVRFIIENTVEERILKLQEKKELVFEGTVGGSSEALGKLTEQDLQFLFQT